jgi:hypothetical protein
LIEATALRHTLAPLARDEDEERRGGKRRRWVQIDQKYARFITVFKSACQSPMISSADEEAFQDLVSDFGGFT